VAEPDFISPHLYLRLAYFESGDYPNYIVELKKDALLTHDAAQSSVAEAAAKGFIQGSEHGLFAPQFSEQKKLYKQGKLSSYYGAQTEARLGNKREAITYLTICVQSHDEFVLNLIDDQIFRSLHGDPAFRQLLVKIGLPRRTTEAQTKTRARTYRSAFRTVALTREPCRLPVADANQGSKKPRERNFLKLALMGQCSHKR